VFGTGAGPEGELGAGAEHDVKGAHWPVSKQEKYASSSSWQAVPPQSGQACANPHATWAASSQVETESGRYVDRQALQRPTSPLLWVHDCHAWSSEGHLLGVGDDGDVGDGAGPEGGLGAGAEHDV
jgi:hypothetical protein